MAHVTSSTHCPSIKNDEAISLLLQFMRHELSGKPHEKVARAIQNCESCRRLYHKLQAFFDESTKVLYELEYPDEVERTDQLIGNIIKFYEPMERLDDGNSKSLRLHPVVIHDDCIGCSA